MNIIIRTATKADLVEINRVIEVAVMSWKLAQRVKRLSLSSYLYNEQDFDHLELVVAMDDQNNSLGVGSWEVASNKDAPSGHTALLLHGLYVDPAFQHQGIGRELFRSAESAVQRYRVDGLMVKAQKDAKGFFESQSMIGIEVENPVHNYLNRFWKNVCPPVFGLIPRSSNNVSMLSPYSN